MAREQDNTRGGKISGIEGLLLDCLCAASLRMMVRAHAHRDEQTSQPRFSLSQSQYLFKMKTA